MDEVFRNLQKEGRNGVENLTKWIIDSGLVEDTEEYRRNLRVLLENVSNHSKVELEKFKEVIQRIAKEHNKTFEEVANKLAAEGPKLKAEFDENIKPRLADEAAEYERNLRILFDEIRSNNEEELEKVQEIFQKVAGESQKYLDVLANQLAAEGPRIMSAVEAGVKAFAEALQRNRQT